MKPLSEKLAKLEAQIQPTGEKDKAEIAELTLRRNRPVAWGFSYVPLKCIILRPSEVYNPLTKALA